MTKFTQPSREVEVSSRYRLEALTLEALPAGMLRKPLPKSVLRELREWRSQASLRFVGKSLEK